MLTKLAGTTFSIMTNGPLPLCQHLHPEARKMAISLQKYLYHYLDLSKEINRAFTSAPSMTDLSQMAECILLVLLCVPVNVSIVCISAEEVGRKLGSHVDRLISSGNFTESVIFFLLTRQKKYH